MSKSVLFQTIQFNVNIASMPKKYSLTSNSVLHNYTVSSIWLIDRPPLMRAVWARVDLGTMPMNGYSAFPKAPALLEPRHQIAKCHMQDTRCGGFSPLCRDAVGLFYSPSRLDKGIVGCKPFPKVLMLSKKLAALSRVWTCITVSSFY